MAEYYFSSIVASAKDYHFSSDSSYGTEQYDEVGSKFLLRAADISTGKYGMGMNTITLDTKLNSTIPRYPSSNPKLKKFSIINKI